MAEEKNKIQMTQDYELELLNTFLGTTANERSYLGPALDYIKSELRKEKYKKVSEDDDAFSDYIKQKYGSANMFFEMNQQLREERVYNPLTDYDIEVEIITKDEYLKTNFISSKEIFLEILDGVATIQYFKKDGNAAQLTGTLKKSFIPSSQYETREKVFGFFGGQRVLIWDIIKQDWSSFYVPMVRRFIRDDTTDLQ